MQHVPSFPPRLRQNVYCRKGIRTQEGDPREAVGHYLLRAADFELLFR